MRLDASPPGRPGTVRRLVSLPLALLALVALAACTSSAPAPAPAPPKPTTPPAASTASPNTASPVAAAANAPASPSVSPQASPSPRVGAQLRIADASLADSTPWLSLQNTGDEAIAVAGWRVEVGEQVATIPEDATVEPGRALTLHARDGIHTASEVFLGADATALARAALPGTPVRLVDAAGQVVAETTVPQV